MWLRIAELIAPLDADRRFVVDALVVKPDSNADSIMYKCCFKSMILLNWRTIRSSTWRGAAADALGLLARCDSIIPPADNFSVRFFLKSILFLYRCFIFFSHQQARCLRRLCLVSYIYLVCFVVWKKKRIVIFISNNINTIHRNWYCCIIVTGSIQFFESSIFAYLLIDSAWIEYLASTSKHTRQRHACWFVHFELN